jgi:hypothetical protein
MVIYINKSKMKNKKALFKKVKKSIRIKYTKNITFTTLKRGHITF